MKRYFKASFFICLITILSMLIAACGSSSGGQTASSEEAESAPAETSSASEDTASDTSSASAETAASDAQWPAQEALKAMDAADITGIEYSFATEGGMQSGTVTDPGEIEDVYLRLCNVRVAGSSDMAVTDDDMRIVISSDDRTLSFGFEGDILVLENGDRYEVEQLGSLKSYLNGLLPEAAAAPAADAGSGTPEAGTPSEASIGDYLVFASEDMDFSFLYEPRHKAYIGSTGVAMLAIDGDENRTGLFVSVVDAENMPSVEQYFEESIFNLQQRYLNAMAVQPELGSTTIEGHELTGISYSYSGPHGGTIDCTEFLEVRDGKYIFYDTRAPRGGDGAELTAMGVAMESLQFDADYYGEPDAVKGSLPMDDFEAEQTSVTDDGDWGRADAEPIETGGLSVGDFESGFTFDVDSSYLMISDETATQVYTGGAMDGAYFSVEKVELEKDIGNTVVDRQNEVTEFLGVRIVSAPEVELLEVGDRRLAGIKCAYSAVDGSKTIESEEYYEELNGVTYCWYAIYDRGDTVTPAAMEHAMETFAVQ